MMSKPDCPSEVELLEVAMDDATSATLDAHVETCVSCRETVRRLRAEMSTLRRVTNEPSPFATLPRLETEDTEELAGRLEAAGKYRILARCGRGAQGQVYRAFDMELTREVAIKVTTEAASETIDAERLKDEARTLAKLDHQNLVRFYEFDDIEGVPYLVYEFIDGDNLSRYRKTHNPTARESALLIAKLARAVEHAHERNVIHQDIKPDNILVEDGGNPRLADFGIAQVRKLWSGNSCQVGGTVGYMAPEEARFIATQTPVEISKRADVFSLGAVLYYLVVGKAPYESIQQGANGDVDCDALQHAPRQLRNICLRAMAADPSNRSATAGDLARALHRYATKGKRFLIGISVFGIIALAILLGTVAATLMRPTPRVPNASLAIYHRVDENTRKLVDRNYGPLWDTDTLELEGLVNEVGHRYMLTIGGNGQGTIYAEEEISSNESGVWRWRPGPPKSETLILIVSRDRLSEVADLAVRLNRLGKPPDLHRSQQIVWSNGSWKTVESEFDPRGQPLPKVGASWADRLVAILNEKDLQFHGRTIYVESSQPDDSGARTGK